MTIGIRFTVRVRILPNVKCFVLFMHSPTLHICSIFKIKKKYIYPTENTKPVKIMPQGNATENHKSFVLA